MIQSNESMLDIEKSTSLEAKADVELNHIATSQASPEDIITNRESISNESVTNGTVNSNFISIISFKKNHGQNYLTMFKSYLYIPCMFHLSYRTCAIIIRSLLETALEY